MPTNRARAKDESTDDVDEKEAKSAPRTTKKKSKTKKKSTTGKKKLARKADPAGAGKARAAGAPVGADRMRKNQVSAQRSHVARAAAQGRRNQARRDKRR